MKKLFALIAVSLFFLAACSSPSQHLVGTWKVSKVETNFKDTNLPKSVIAHIKNEQKKISFKIVNDSILVLMLDNNTHEARWKMNPKTKVINYYFHHQKNAMNKLGTWEGNDIVSESSTPLGKLTVVFKKQ
jgi:PBP1b-binding outer membrane lipoprotein LpoB